MSTVARHVYKFLLSCWTE